MARPQKNINEEQVLKLAELQCTFEEIAAFFDVDKSTISRRFATIINKGRELGKISLRRRQFKLAEKSAAMAIFLGKNYLAQEDKFDHTGLPETIGGSTHITYVINGNPKDYEQRRFPEGVVSTESGSRPSCSEVSE